MSLSTAPGSFNEADDVTVAVSRTASKGEARVTLVPSLLSGGSAAQAGDFDSTPVTVAFPAGVTTVSVTVPVVDDAVVEPDEAFRLDLAAPSKGYGLAVGASGGEVVILNDDIATSNVEPTAEATSASGWAGDPIVVTLTGHDADGDALTFAAGTATSGLVGVPSGAACDGTTPSTCTATSTYTPNAGFTGTDSFTYTVNDGTTDSASATVSITVNPLNAQPTAEATSASSSDGDPIVVTLTGHDADGDALTFAAGTATNGLVSVPSGAACDGTTPSTCTATSTYTPNAGFTGTDSFTYTVNDGTTDSAAATVSITVGAVNDAPVAEDDVLLPVAEDTGKRTIAFAALTGNDSKGAADESAQALTITDIANPVGGVILIDGTDVTFTPDANFNGAASFDYTVQDNGTTDGIDDFKTDIGSVSFTVTPVNDEPSFTKGLDQSSNEDAGARSVSNWGTAISKGPADESGQTLSFNVSNDNNTLFSTQPDVSSTGTLTYTSAANRYGSATVTVSLSDDGGTADGGDDTSSSETFTITVNRVNDAPVAAPKSFTVQANMKISLGGLLVGATDPNDVAGDAAWTPSFTLGSISVGAGCIGCTISNVDSANGTFDLDPPAGGTGTFTVTYTVVDNGSPAPGATSAPQTITFTVIGPIIWFVDDSASNFGTGRLSAPFNSLAAADAVDAANHRIFLYSGTYPDGLALHAGEWLMGQGATSANDFDSLMAITPPAGTFARPPIGGATPVVQGTVTLNTDTRVEGVEFSTDPEPAAATSGVNASRTSTTAIARRRRGH